MYQRSVELTAMFFDDPVSQVRVSKSESRVIGKWSFRSRHPMVSFDDIMRVIQRQPATLKEKRHHHMNCIWLADRTSNRVDF